MLLELRSKKFTVSNLRCSEIDQLKMPFLIKHEILRLNTMLNTLRSRWVMPLEWRYYSILTI